MLLCKGQTTLHAEVGVVFQCLFYLMRVSFQIIRFGIEHRQAHPATDIHPYGIGDDGIVRGEYTADGQTVSGMCIGHQCAGYADGEPHGQVHLLFGEGFYELAAIGFIGQRLVEQVVCCELLFDEGGGQVFGQFAPCLILFISIGIFQHVAQCLDNLFFALVLAMFTDDGYCQTACYIVSISQLT